MAAGLVQGGSPPSAAVSGGRPARGRAARPLLLLLALQQGVPGLWALLLPRSFYGSFPLPALAWAARFPPYSGHLLRDLGAASLGLALAPAYAAVHPERAAVRAAALGCLGFAVPHLAFHLMHLGSRGAVDLAAQLLVLVAPVAAAGFLLLTRRPQK